MARRTGEVVHDVVQDLGSGAGKLGDGAQQALRPELLMFGVDRLVRRHV
ncbi:MAG: hypothetical protein R2834_09775 [Rhodothermales bacterium]